MSKTDNLQLEIPSAADKHIFTTYKNNNEIIDEAYGQYLEDQETSQENIAMIESSTAQTNHAVGSYFMLDNVLHKATSAIASGETITSGSNATPITIEEALTALNTSVNSLQDSVAYTAVSPTTAAYSKHDILFYDNALYRVAKDIPAGTTLVKGNNITSYTTNMGLQIGALRRDLEKSVQYDRLGSTKLTTTFELRRNFGILMGMRSGRRFITFVTTWDNPVLMSGSYDGKVTVSVSNDVVTVTTTDTAALPLTWIS